MSQVIGAASTPAKTCRADARRTSR